MFILAINSVTPTSENSPHSFSKLGVDGIEDDVDTTVDNNQHLLDTNHSVEDVGGRVDTEQLAHQYD